MVEIFSIGRRRCASRFLFISSTWAVAVLWYLMRNNASSPICRRVLLNKAVLCLFIATVFHLNDPSCIIDDATLLKLARCPLFHHSLPVQLLGRSECSVNCKFFDIISIKLIFGCLRGRLGVYYCDFLLKMMVSHEWGNIFHKKTNSCKEGVTVTLLKRDRVVTNF